MGICIDNKSCLKENLIYILPSVRAELLITLCLEIPCRLQKDTFQKTGQPDQKPDFGVRDIKIGHKLMQNEIGQ